MAGSVIFPNQIFDRKKISSGWHIFPFKNVLVTFWANFIFTSQKIVLFTEQVLLPWKINWGCQE